MNPEKPSQCKSFRGAEPPKMSRNSNERGPPRRNHPWGYHAKKALLEITTDNEDKLKILTGLRNILAQCLMACCL